MLPALSKAAARLASCVACVGVRPELPLPLAEPGTPQIVTPVTMLAGASVAE